MWQAVSPVSSEHDPIVYEGRPNCVVAVMNAGPGFIQMRGWTENISRRDEPDFQLELRSGDTRIVSACLLRARLLRGNFCAIAWSVMGHAE